MTAAIIAALKTVYDPEIPVDIYELGLIYKVDIDDDRKVTIDMTLTAPGLPGRGRHAGMGGECGRARSQGVGGVQGQSRVRSALGSFAHVG